MTCHTTINPRANVHLHMSHEDWRSPHTPSDACPPRPLPLPQDNTASVRTWFKPIPPVYSKLRPAPAAPASSRAVSAARAILFAFFVGCLVALMIFVAGRISARLIVPPDARSVGESRRSGFYVSPPESRPEGSTAPGRLFTSDAGTPAPEGLGP